MDTTVFTLVFAVIWAFVAHSMGKNKGFDPAGSAVAGFLFGLIAVIVIAVRKAKN